MMNDPVNPNDIGDASAASMRITRRSTPPGLAPKTAHRTSLGHRLQRALTGGPNRRFPGLHSPPGGAASTSLLANRRLSFPILALLALLAAGLMFLLPGGPLQAQSGDAQVDYAENGTDPVATYTGLDPEGRPVYWSLLPAETAADLNNDGDVLDPGEATEDNPSADVNDFMISSDGVLSFKFPPDFEDATSSTTDGTLAANNVYKIVVVASDDALGAAVDDNSADIRMKDYHKVTVHVGDVDEAGSISLSNQQPQMGIALTATLADQDTTPAQITNAKWKWEHGTAADGPWTVIVGATTSAQTPVAGLVGEYLRATATYTDAYGDDKTAMAVSAHAIRAVPGGTNSSPAFPDEDAATSGIQVARTVKENSPPGTNVGKPVAAGDAGDILTYSLTGTDASNYRIDRATGQITVGPRTMLNREDSDDVDQTVTVTATDPWGIEVNGETESATTQEVTITIGNVNEAPKIIGGVTRSEQDENQDGNDDATGIQPPEISQYVATDLDENDTATWSVSGPDAGDFNISTAGILSFKTNPNYEKPADADMDNAYMVTVVATDAGTSTDRRIGVDKLTATRDVVITVMNADDMGTITLSSVQPKVGIDLVATLADEDGGVKDVKWQWYDADIVVSDFTTNAIAKATSATYTPVAGDVGKTLSVRAAYTDAFGSISAPGTSANAVVADLANRAPVFEDTNGKVITSDTRSVAENSVEDATVGPPVEATDPGDTLTYTLGGRDASSFGIGPTDGQITVKAGTKLDYDGSKKSYTVTVTATDPSRDTATITITINLIDVNEGPVIVDGDEEFVREFKENSGSTIHTFRATDPEGRTVYWSLSREATDNEDVDLFSISSTGALKFESPLPDYENPGDDGENNSYKVIVEASDDAPGVGTPVLSSMRKVIINVTNASESGSVSVNRRYAQVTVAVEATLTDGDATAEEIGAATYRWYTGTNTEVGTGASYSPTDTKTLKVEATYDAQGDTRTATKTGITVRAVPGSNGAPTFPESTAARSVDENKRAGTNVGKTIVAIDPDSADRSKLTYSVPPDTNFSINNNGQLETKVPLDHEVAATFNVTVTATDPSGDTGTVTVTVTVNDVNETPTIDTGPTRANNRPEDIPVATVVATYVASDPETDDADDLVWSLTGTDASDFNIGNQGGGTPGELTFKEMPDFEKPAATRNLYRVIVNVSDGKLKATRAMTVTVTDVAEDGEITLSSVQPKVAVDLIASLEDSDGGVKDVTWQWYDGAIEDANLTTNAIDGATSATYTPVAGDVGKTLSVRAAYTDRRGETSATAPAAAVVITNTDNRAPVFRAGGVAAGKVITSDTRSVPENSVAGTGIGAAVVATDPNPLDQLTYMLSGTDAALFEILTVNDPATDPTDERGQIQVKAGTKLNYEAKNTYMVTVTATDPNGLSDSIDVTIMVTDVDEAPEIMRAPDSNVAPEFASATTSRTVAENMVAGEDIANPVAANDANGDALTYVLGGTDAASFDIKADTGQLMTKEALDYETKDSYEVTVTATDPDSASDMITVTITVTNEEEMGEVTLWAGADALTMAPQVGDTITGAVMDPDGGVTGETWQWAKTKTPNMMESWMPITGATDAAYMVTADDTGYYLRVMATYTDAVGTDMAMEYSPAAMMVTTMMTVPMFESETATRVVAENTAADTGIGDPVTATDADGDTLIYTLGGTDAASFDIKADTGQLMTKEALDYETKDSYEVMVTAEDSDGASDSIDVTVTVTNVAELGTVSGDATVSYAENGTDPVGTYTADGPDTATWTVSGADMDDFSIGADGMLMFVASPNYEAAADADTDNIYQVTVQADAGGEMDQVAVTVTVTDVDEMGTGDALVDRYDANSDGEIDRAEVGQAVRDFIGRQIEHDDVVQIIAQYFKDLRSES